MSSAAHADEGTIRKDGAFLRSRMGSLLAVLPLGVWSVNHLWDNLAAFQGPDAWQVAVTEYPHPLAQLATGVMVLLPLVLHTIWGLRRLATSRPNNLRYGYFANLRYTLQRLSAVGLVLFLGAHLWLAMLKPRLQTGQPEGFADLAHEMHFHLPTLVVYLLGTLGLAYHLANGLQTFAMGWGVVSSRSALRRLDGLVVIAFAVLVAMGWGAIFAIYTAVA
jgi:succinate dehydrogenase / fumarate reductase cytochrome b subunit